MLPATTVPVGVGVRGVRISSVQDLMTLATAMFKAGLCPAHIKSPEAAFGVMAFGMELGLSPIQSLKDIAFIGGRPSAFGDAITALLLNSGLLVNLPNPVYANQGENRSCTCTLWRRGMEDPVERAFSMADAKRARLLSKQGPWQDYPDRMLWWRSFGWATRDGFADVLKGLWVREELEDMERGNFSTTPQQQSRVVRRTIDLRSEPRINRPEPQESAWRVPVDDLPGAREPEAIVSHVAAPVPTEAAPLPSPEPEPEPTVAPAAPGTPTTGDAKDLRLELRRMVLDLAGQDQQVARSMLEGYSSFEKDGKVTKGWPTVSDPRASDRWVQATYGKVKEDWEEKFSDPLNSRPNQ